jgi:hypothetical protein
VTKSTEYAWQNTVIEPPYYSTDSIRHSTHGDFSLESIAITDTSQDIDTILKNSDSKRPGYTDIMDSTKPALKVLRISSLDQAEQLVDLACEAFMDDYWFSLIVPGRREHPDTFRKMWSSNFREAYGDKGSVILAAYREDEDSDDGRREFLAFAVWTRFGTSDVARSWQGDSWNKSKSVLPQHKYHD